MVLPCNPRLSDKPGFATPEHQLPRRKTCQNHHLQPLGPPHKESIYNFGNGNPAEKVAQVIGGAVAVNIRLPKDPWENTCAVRMSYILNETGTYIPRVPGKTVTGKDKRNYFFRVDDLISFLRQQWGAPEVIKYPPPGALAGQKGIILFEITGFSDARGHATLYDGHSCYDRCYFHEREAAHQTTKANFWSLP